MMTANMFKSERGRQPVEVMAHSMKRNKKTTRIESSGVKERRGEERRREERGEEETKKRNKFEEVQFEQVNFGSFETYLMKLLWRMVERVAL